MKLKNDTNRFDVGVSHYEQVFGLQNLNFLNQEPLACVDHTFVEKVPDLPEILVITSYPPRECGIATYSHDLISAVNTKFSDSLSIKVCALESGHQHLHYPEDVKYVLNTSVAAEFGKLALKINQDNRISMVLLQHEFGFYNEQEKAFLKFLNKLSKPIVIVFHTVLPNPDALQKALVQEIATACRSIIVMTNSSAQLLIKSYGIPSSKINIIAHGTHLVSHLNKEFLKEKYGLTGRKVLSTFGLLSGGKGIETTLRAMPAIIKSNPDVLFLIIGKTHPEVIKNDGEVYRKSLGDLVIENKLAYHVRFINSYLDLPVLLEYLQLTDIYLFTTNDPNQAVSGTFVYAMSCACPIISAPIPHAKELLNEETGIIFDFRNEIQLAEAVNRLLDDEPLRKRMSLNILQKIIPTAWENSAIGHAQIFEKISSENNAFEYNLPSLNLDHLYRMTTPVGIIQFSNNNEPDLSSGYTLDDNARALIAACMYFEETKDEEIVYDIEKYLAFITHCLQPTGSFLNYLDRAYKFTKQNFECNLDDSNGRAIWALGYLVSQKAILPSGMISKAGKAIAESMNNIGLMRSTRAMAFAIKGLYYYHKSFPSIETINLIILLSNRLVQMYRHESSEKWEWFEGYLTYANSILPEALLYAWLLTGQAIYKNIAKVSFRFLMTKTFNQNGIEVISNKNWLLKGNEIEHFGEQPIDVAYTVMTLSEFYNEFKDEDYWQKMETAFNWFQGKNRLQQIIYNPCTGGCYDGLEETQVNLNQGAESLVSYLMARLTMEKYKDHENEPKTSRQVSKNIYQNV